MRIRWKLATLAALAIALLAWIVLGSDGPEVTQSRSCSIDETAATATTMQGITLDVLPATAWQPRGGRVEFTLTASSKGIELKKTEVGVCFGWQTAGNAAEANVRSPNVEIIRATDTSVTLAAIVSDLPPIPKRWPNRLWVDKDSPYHFFSSGLVPIATMRVQVSGDGLTPPLDVIRPVGVTSVWCARATAVVAGLLAFVLLSLSARFRGVPGHQRPVLGIISNRDGYASLSQFQLIVWSFVVGVGAVYVLTLSGGLIDVPDQMLVLLGITGVTVLGARVPDGSTKSDTPKLAPPTIDDVGGVAVVAPAIDSLGVRWNATRSRKYDVQYREAGSPNWTMFATGTVQEWCRITGLQPNRPYAVQVRSTDVPGGGTGAWSGEAAGRTLAAPREPRWSDLIVVAGTLEIDVTRVQMLFFTLIAASFVATRLFNSYEIPAVPTGFLWLMGLSNGVYLSAKFVPS